jgi:hypothetical protein
MVFFLWKESIVVSAEMAAGVEVKFAAVAEVPQVVNR